MDSNNYIRWFETIYPRLTGNGLWLRGGEINALPPEEYDRRLLRILITRLSTAVDTSESLTHKLLYGIAKSLPEVFPDMAYLPPKNDARLFERDGIPWLLGTNTKRGPMDFNVIAFSNSIVQEMVNLPVMLGKSGIPVHKSERKDRADIPLILLGGANALWTSIFWNSDPPLDGIFVGESIECIEKIFSICRDGKQKGLRKQAILQELETIPGFFQPDRLYKTKKFYALNLSGQNFFPDLPVMNIKDQPGRGTIPISEGCPSFCSFCSESFVRKPYRELPPENVVERAMRMKAAMGLDRIELSSFNFNVHSGFYQILDGLTDSFETVGLKSMRFDVLAHDPQMLPHLLAAGKNSLTCGLEGISSGLRRRLSKNLSDKDLAQSLKQLFESPVRELKIFVIATGLEREEDFVAFQKLLKSISGMRSISLRPPHIVFSVTPLVRFPWTPLEFEDAPSADQMRSDFQSIEKLIQQNGFESRRAMGIPEWWLSQTLVRISNPLCFSAFIRTIRKTNFVYDHEIPDTFIRVFQEELKKEGVDPDSLLLGTQMDGSDKKPWELIETGLPRTLLIDRYRKCLVGVEKGSHTGTPTEIRSADKLKTKIANLKREEKHLDFLIEADETVRGLPRKILGTALARALMLSESGLIPAFRRFQKSFWEERTPPVWITGDDVLTLVFRGGLITDWMNLLADDVFMRKVNERLMPFGKFKGIMREAPQTFEIKAESAFPFDGSAYLKSENLNHTLIKVSKNRFRYEFSREARKKNIITEMTCQNKPDGNCEINLLVGPKFDPTVFAKRAFILPEKSDWVRIRMRSAFR